MVGLVAACGSGKTVATLPPGFRQDTFAQEAASKIDILWIIDNSESMTSVQDELSTSLTRFMDTLSRGLVDYRIAVTTTDVFSDPGQFVGNPPVIDPSLSDPVFQFQRNVRVGTQGKAHEEAFEAARLAIEREKASAAAVLEELDACLAQCAGAQACRGDCARRHEPRFMRRGAHLYLVFVSDEEEQSAGEVRFFQRTFESALGAGNEGSVTVATICGVAPIPEPCKAHPGVRYAALAGATGGITASICDPTFDGHLKRLALDAAGLKHKFALAARPDLSTLGVEVRYRCDTDPRELHCESVDDGCAGKARDARALVCRPREGEVDGYSFEESTQSLFFRGASVPGLRSEVVASYQVAAD